MNPQAAQNYLKSRVFTATPEQLQLMLYDGALRFGEQARLALQQKNFEQSYSMISRVQKIINELSCSLKHQVYPDLCTKLSSLYNYVHRKLIDANVNHNIESLNEAIGLLKFQRETWAMLLQQLGQQKAAEAASQMDIPEPDTRMEASLSVEG